MRTVIAAVVLTTSSVALLSAQPAVERAAAVGDAPQVAQEAPERGGAGGFVRDVGGDYAHFFSWSTAKWLGVGGLAAAAIHPADEEIRDATQASEVATQSGTVGQVYGSQSFQAPLAVAWWVVGHAAGSSRAAEAGRDLVRAQINTMSWTFSLKYAVNRERPNGDPRSFPSGHASATFATAMVLQEHYGWKLGVPFFTLATYTAASRVVQDKHWTSDVVFGAFMGMASGRTVTMRLRSKTVSVAPLAVPGGGGVLVSLGRLE